MFGPVRELARARELLVTLTARHLKLRAKRSWLSTVWPVAVPFVLTAIYVFVFQRVFNAPIDRYPIFLLCGLIPWLFLAQSVQRGMISISSEVELVRGASFPYALLPISTTLAYGTNLLITLGALAGYLGVTGQLAWGVLPVLLIPLACLVLFVMSLTILAALIDVYNHDLRHLMGQLLGIWFFLVPIVYRPTMAPEPFHTIQSFEPMNGFARAFREVLYWGGVPSLGAMAAMLAVTGCTFVLSVAIFRRWSRDLAKDL